MANQEPNLAGGAKITKAPKKTPEGPTGKGRPSPVNDDVDPLHNESSKSLVKTTSSSRMVASSSSRDYTDENEYLTSRIEEQAKTIIMLRQKEVDQNQVAMSKDEYKKRNNELTEENIRLQRENQTLTEQSSRMFATEIDTRKQKVMELEKKSAQLMVQYDEMQSKFREIESIVSKKDFGLTEELTKEKDKLKEVQAKVDRVNGQLQQLTRLRAKSEPMQKDVHTFVKERNEALDFIMDRGKDIQDRQKENYVLLQQAEHLEQVVIKLQDEIGKMKEKSSG